MFNSAQWAKEVSVITKIRVIINKSREYVSSLELNPLQTVAMSNLLLNVASACFIGCGVLLFSTATQSVESHLYGKILWTALGGLSLTYVALRLLKENKDA